MNAKTLMRLKATFENKVCTVFTKPVCRTFTDRLWREHYAVRVKEITTDGLWGEHPYSKTTSFFFAEQIVFIQEEIELDPNNPMHAKMIKDYEDQTGEKILSDVSPHLAPSIDYKVDIDDVVEDPDMLPVMVKEKAPVEEPEDESVFVDIASLDELAKFTRQQSMMKNMTKLPNFNSSGNLELVQIS